MQVKTKLFLFLLIFSGLFLSILVANWYINKSSEKLYIKVQNEKLKQSVKISLSVNNELFASIVNENSYWDEMRDYALTQDTNFGNKVLKPMVNYENVDYLWTYNLNTENICTSNKKTIKFIHDPLNVNLLYNIFDTIANSTKRFTNFYIKSDSMVYVVNGATIHSSEDVERREKPTGFFLLGKGIDKKYLDKLSVLTNSKVYILFDTLKLKREKINPIFTISNLYDSENRYVASLIFIKEDNFIFENKSNQKKILIIFIIMILLSIIIVLIIFYFVFTKPFNAIILSLDNNNIKYVDKILEQENEFGKISRLIDSFLQQTDEVQAMNDQLNLVNQELVKLSIVAEETDNSIVILDNEANILWFNVGFSKLYGYTFDEYIEKFGKNFIAAIPNPNVKIAFDNCVKLKKSVTYESMANNRKNEKIWLQVTLTPIFDEFNEVSKVIGIETNISKLKEFEQEILQKNEEILTQKEELEQMNAQINEQNENIKASIRYAQTIQNAILPSDEKINLFFDNYLIYKPKDIVSGDFYWLNYIAEEKEKSICQKIFIAVVDCTGHGVPGAFMSMIANTLISEIINDRLIHSPDLIIDELDKSIRKILDQDKSDNRDGMDLCLCKIEKDFDGKQKLTFAGAKRPIFYYNSLEDKMNIIEPTSRSVGGYVSRIDKKFENKIFDLSKGDLITLSTDGFADQNNFLRKRFSSRKLIAILEQNVKLSLIEQKLNLEDALNKWTVDTKQRDDITILTIKI